MVGPSTKGAGGGTALGDVWLAIHMGSSVSRQLVSTGPETRSKHMVLERGWAYSRQTQIYILFHRVELCDCGQDPCLCDS